MTSSRASAVVVPPRSVAVPALAYRLGGAAKALNVSTRTVRRLIEAGDLPASRIGRALLIEVSAIEALLARTRIGQAP